MPRGVTLVAVGDMMLGDSPQVFGYGVGSQIRRHGALHPFTFVGDRLRSADIRLGNLEVVISAFDPAVTPFDGQVYRGQPEAVDGLVAAGFDVLSICTNHTMQHGQAAFEEAAELVRRRDIEVIGAECPRIGLSNASILEREGLRFGFLGYNFRPQQYFVAAPAWPAPDADLIGRDVTALRDRADIAVVTLHWGDEFIDHPAPSQVELAHRLVDAGADVIIGHHTHILQGVERYKGAVIAYSLGNFVYDQWQRRLRESMILRLTIRGSRDMDCRMEPVLINGLHQPVPLEGDAASVAVARLGAVERNIGGSSPTDYARELDASNRRFRREIYLHYATAFWRSNPRHFLANLSGVIRRRISPHATGRD